MFNVVHVLKKYRKNNLTWQYLFNGIHRAAKKRNMKATEARKFMARILSLYTILANVMFGKNFYNIQKYCKILIFWKSTV